MGWEVITPIVIAIVGPLIAYFGAVSKGKSNLRELEVKNKFELEKLNAEVEAQAKLYEQNKQTDIASDMFQGLMGDPSMQKMMMGMVIKEMSDKK